MQTILDTYCLLNRYQIICILADKALSGLNFGEWLEMYTAHYLEDTSLNKQHGKALKIILWIVVIIAAIIGAAFYFTQGVANTANDQLRSIQAGNVDEAYGMTSKAFQNETSLEQFNALVNQFPVLNDFKEVTFWERKVEDNTGYLSGTIESNSGAKMKIEYQLIKEDGKWKIQAMRLSETGAQAPESEPETTPQTKPAD